MKKNFLVKIIFLSFVFKMSAQTCDCEKEFLFIKKYIETNYVGFKDKVNVSNKKEYEAYSKKLQQQSKSFSNPGYCLFVIKKYLSFFKDHHVQVAGKEKDISDNDTTAIRKLLASTEKIILSKEILSELEKKPLSDIEGIYNHTSGNYKIALIKNKNSFRDYAGVIIEAKNKFWLPGNVKLELKHVGGDKYESILYNKFHDPVISEVTVKNGAFRPSEFMKAGAKPIPGSEPDFEPFEKIENSDAIVFIQSVNDSTNYLRIKSFDGSYTKDIDSVVSANEVLLKSKPYLVLDLRNNGGGSDASYSSLIPFMYTDPIRSVGTDVYATPDNVKAVQRMLAENESEFSESSKKRINETIKRMQENPFKLILSNEDEIDTLPEVYKYPKKIAVLINGGCGSTTEEFLLAAKQSKKVITFGQTTVGVLDYSNVRPVDFSCMNYILGYSTTRSRRIPKNAIDNVGIKPDVKMIFGKDWLEKVLAGLK